MQIQSVPIPVLPHMRHSESLIWAGSLGFVVSIEVSTAEHAPDPTLAAHGGRTRGEPAAASPESIDPSPALVAASGAVEQDQMPSIIRQTPSISWRRRRPGIVRRNRLAAAAGSGSNKDPCSPKHEQDFSRGPCQRQLTLRVGVVGLGHIGSDAGADRKVSTVLRRTPSQSRGAASAISSTGAMAR